MVECLECVNQHIEQAFAIAMNTYLKIACESKHKSAQKCDNSDALHIQIE